MGRNTQDEQLELDLSFEHVPLLDKAITVMIAPFAISWVITSCLILRLVTKNDVPIKIDLLRSLFRK